MSFFQQSVQNKYLSQLDDKLVNEAYRKYSAYFLNPQIQENIRDSKEEQFQEGFLRELFVNILGYTINPTPGYNLTTELKNEKGAKKADGAIMKDGKAIAVIELKGTDTIDLDKVTNQAFNYKNNQSSCVYVITSNFEKLRLYINDSISFEEFHLFTLSAEQFKLLWLCFSKDSIFKNIPLKIKEESSVAEENITKQLYKDYSAFRNALWNNLVQQNSNYNKLLLFKKTQKLLDRFLFIFFAEDKGLLPPNSISDIVKKWEKLRDMDEYRPLYDRFKKYFGYLNTGYRDKEHEIFAYNGGLFLPDEVLDTINISDEVLHPHITKLTAYNYESEIDVNILGHIFEHSLTEIDSITAEIEGKEIDKGKTKRKKDGVFYTPKYITKYIVENTVGKLCKEKKEELQIAEEEYEKGRKGRSIERLKELDGKLQAYRNWLLQITICDPACGSGAFLNQALDFLIHEHRYIDELQAKLLKKSIVFEDVENHILEKNIFGVDINEESVEIAKLSLWLRTAQKGRKLNSLNNNIKCGNSLIDNVAVAGDKAFNWQKEFPTVFDKGGFDVVIGNPPYVFARDKISQQEKDYYVSAYVSAEYQVNTYLLFIEQTIKLIKHKSKYGLIIPNAWLMISSAKGLRKFILDNCKIDEIINLAGYSFEGVNVETIIIIAEKTHSLENEIRVLLNNGQEFYLSHHKNQHDFLNLEGVEFSVFSNEESSSLVEKLQENSFELDDIVEIKAGLKAYEKDKGNPKQSENDVKSRPFDYTYKHDESTYKYLDGKNVGRYQIGWSGSFLKYGVHLAAPRTIDLFNGQKIIIREITGKYPKSILASYTEEFYLFNMSNIAIIEKQNSEVLLKYILALLNSSLMSFYFLKNTAKSVRKMFPKIILNDLRKFPFKKIEHDKQRSFVEKVDVMLLKNRILIETQSQFTSLLQSKFDLPKLTTKLENWHTLDFKDFLKELKKAKISMTLPEEAEWMNYFNEQKQKAQQLKTDIDKTDKEIDKMVYALYELTEEEIKIVEGK